LAESRYRASVAGFFAFARLNAKTISQRPVSDTLEPLRLARSHFAWVSDTLYSETFRIACRITQGLAIYYRAMKTQACLVLVWCVLIASLVRVFILPHAIT
jgi:hypothetical protein